MYANLFLRAGLSLEIDRVAWGSVKFWKSLRMVVYSCSGQPVLVFQHIQNDLVYNVPSIVMTGLIFFLFFHTLQTAFLKFMGFFLYVFQISLLICFLFGFHLVKIILWDTGTVNSKTNSTKGVFSLNPESLRSAEGWEKQLYFRWTVFYLGVTGFEGYTIFETFFWKFTANPTEEPRRCKAPSVASLHRIIKNSAKE